MLVFLRIGGIIFALPFVGDSSTPLLVRIFLTVAISAGVTGSLPASWLTEIPPGIFPLGGLVLSELIIGLIIGFVARVFFAGILMASSIVGYQMGFGTASLLIPDADAQMDGFTAFHRYVVLLIFFSLNLHHIFFTSIIQSFQFIPAGGASTKSSIFQILINVTGNIFLVALQLAAPVLIALMFTMAALGLIARTVPQMNVFTLSFPISFFIGLLIYIASLPFFSQWITQGFSSIQDDIMLILQALY